VLGETQQVGNQGQSPKERVWPTHIALLIVQFAFASQAVEAKLAMLPRAEGGEGIFPEALAMVRMIGGALFFQAAAFSLRKRSILLEPARRIESETGVDTAKIHVKLVGLAALGVALNQGLFLAGLRVSTPFAVSLLGATIPVFTASLAVVFRKEPASWRTGVGLVLALSGVLWLTGVGSSVTQLDRGALLVAINCFSYSLYVVFSRNLVIAIGSLRLMAWVFTYAAIMFAPLGLRPFLHELPQLTTRGWLLITFIVAVPTIVAYGLNAWALARSTATIVTIYIYMQPLIAAVLAKLQLGYSISSRAGLAAVLILGGVAITTLKTKRVA
jgi:drug/metabolite transporter (DMT)-like permease